MTPDEPPHPMTHPERAEEILQRQYDRRKLAEARGADVGANKLYGDIDALLSLLTASEKRAETARDDALEEAAMEIAYAGNDLVRRIRAMKGQR